MMTCGPAVFFMQAIFVSSQAQGCGSGVSASMRGLRQRNPLGKRNGRIRSLRIALTTARTPLETLLFLFILFLFVRFSATRH